MKDFGGETRWKEPFGRHRSRWNDNIKLVLQETGRKDVEWIDLAQDMRRMSQPAEELLASQKTLVHGFRHKKYNTKKC